MNVCTSEEDSSFLFGYDSVGAGTKAVASRSLLTKQFLLCDHFPDMSCPSPNTDFEICQCSSSPSSTSPTDQITPTESVITSETMVEQNTDASSSPTQSLAATENSSVQETPETSSSTNSFTTSTSSGSTQAITLVTTDAMEIDNLIDEELANLEERAREMVYS